MREPVPPRALDLEGWTRREHFELFRHYRDPFFNITAEVDVSRALAHCRRPVGPSFFLSTLYLSLRTANEVEPFRYRLRDDAVVVHEVVHGGSTVLRPDDTFAFAYVEYAPSFEEFAARAETALAASRNAGPLDPRDDRDDLIHHSMVPWIAFTGIKHARRPVAGDSVPKIVFGRHHGTPGAERMPVSVEVHHALMDGIHVAAYLDGFQQHLDDAATIPVLAAGDG